MNNAYNTLKEFAADGRLCIIRLENENVIGEFFVDEYSAYTGFSFRSSICPKFIDEDNAVFDEDRKSGMSGYASDVKAVAIDGDNLLVAFDEGCSVYHRVYEIVAFGNNCYDVGSPCRK